MGTLKKSFGEVEAARADTEKALASAKEELGEALTSRDVLEEERGDLSLSKTVSFRGRAP